MDARRRQLILYIQQLEAQLTALFGATYADVLQLSAVRKAIESGEQFTWAGNPAAQAQLQDQLTRLARTTDKAIQNGITGAWKEGEGEVKDILLDRFGKGKNSAEVNTVIEDAVKQQRAKGMYAHAFATEKQGGLTLSDRVWNLAGDAKKELEILIQNGIKEGKSAADLSGELKRYLNDPDSLFRRVRNKETGELELSEAAKKHHPGRGVYRSAYKNALRLAITEMNAAYRRAEWESYQTNPLITGYRIELSNNHTVVINGKVRRLYDICDEMDGKEFPKTFLWTGWHPHCRCRMVPILISDADFKARKEARAAGKLEEWRPQNEVKDLPQAFYDWVEKNRERIKGWKGLPYWMRDNADLLGIENPAKLDEIVYNCFNTDDIEIKREAYWKEAQKYGLTPAEAVSLNQYAEDYFEDMNKNLRNGVANKEELAVAAAINAALDKLPVHSGICFRGVYLDEPTSIEYRNAFNKQQAITFKAFTSSSIERHIAIGFSDRILFKIESKTGRNITKLSYNRVEKEVLFKTNVSFMIDDITTEEINGENFTIYHLREID